MLIKNGKVLLFEEGGFVDRDIRVEGSVVCFVVLYKFE